MSLPNSVQIQDENFLVQENFSNEHEFLYLHSMKETDGISDKSMHNLSKEDTASTPLENFNSFINFP